MADLSALRSAARAAIVMPAVFALSVEVIGNPQTSLFAAFGSFAVLVLVEFAGPARARLLAYLGLGVTGACLVSLGTVCSRDSWLAAGAMAVVGFVVLFAGVIGGYFAAATTGALLTFVLPVTIRAPNSAIPDRLAGWGIAVGAGACASMLLWPPRRQADLRRQGAMALRAVADVLDGGASPESAREAIDGLRRRLLGAQHRPSGPTRGLAALASLPDELDWLFSFVVHPSPLEAAYPEEVEALAAVGALLRASADTLQGRGGRPDFTPLETARDAVAHALVQRLPELPADPDDAAVPRVLEPPFRIRAVAYSARQAAGYALLAAGEEAPALDPADVAQPTGRARERLAVEHASVRSVWFQNSVRGTAGLSVAVFIAQQTGLQHGFWVVLGTLSVLRSNALGTGWSVLSALAGTAVGLVIGALLVVGIGTHAAVLWGILPVAVLLAAYAPRAISFAAGQAAFTVVLFILFNIIQPVGWKVGVVRIEDVSIGFAISLGVGVLFWPRGAAALLRDDLATAYERSADYVLATARGLTAAGDTSDTADAARAAGTALHRLDDAFGQYLAERSATKLNAEDVAALVAGASRVRRAAQSLSALAQMAAAETRLERCAENLQRELDAFHAWYVSFGYALVHRRRVPPPHIRDTEGTARLLRCVRDAAGSRDKSTVKAALVLLWTSQHLENLWRLETHLAARADTLRAAQADAGTLRRLGLAAE